MRNRIASSSEAMGLSASYQVAETSCAVQHEPTSFEHQVAWFGPERYESRYEYPLMLWLHSCNSSEGELENVMPALSLQNYVGCAPRGPLSSKQGQGRFQWGQSPTATAIAEEIIFESIDQASQHFSIHASRIFLTGFGSGASMALRVALRYPERFAGVVAVCGQFPNEQCALSRLDRARSLPVLWMYGEHSRRCGIPHICETLPVLHAAGLSVDIRQYPCGDDLLSNMLGDANAWMMQLITQQPATDSGLSANVEVFSAN